MDTSRKKVKKIRFNNGVICFRSQRAFVRISLNANRIVFNLLFIIMILINGFYYEPDNRQYDYFNYLISYENVGQLESVFEIGYSLLEAISNKIGLSFFQFRFLIITVTLLLVRDSICRYSKSPIVVAVLFFMQPFLLQIIQIRSSLSAAIILYAIRYLSEEEKDVKKYMLFLIIAFLIHQSAILYAVFIFSAYGDNRKTIRKGIGIFFIMSVACLLLREVTLRLMGMFITSKKITQYFLNPQPITSRNFQIWYVSFCLVIIAIYYLCKSNNNNHILKLNVLILSCSPILIIHYDYYRAIDNMMLFIYIYFTNLAHERKPGINRMSLLCVVGMVASVAYAAYYCRMWGNLSEFTVLHNNLFLDKFGF